MRPHEPLLHGWQARLDLGFARRDGTTVLAKREHFGPLRVQKALYPEGPDTCHTVVLHPPSGIVGGDTLHINVAAGENTRALLTTPGAGKWYRSGGPWAEQQLKFEAGSNAMLEWLPQPTIVFDGALAKMEMNVTLAEDATFIGWEILCLGRRAAGEQFGNGMLRLATRIERQGVPLWLERGRIEGGDALMQSPMGLAGHSVCATLLAAGRDVPPALLAACRASLPMEEGALHGITALPRLLVARYLGDSAEAAHNWFIDLWRVLRPALTGREAQLPRIWST